MGETNPIKIGIREQATNNPPIEILVQSYATLSSLPKTWPVDTVAYTPGRAKQWKFTAAGAWETLGEVSIDDLSGVAIEEPAGGQALVYHTDSSSWENTSINEVSPLLLAEETSGEGAEAVTQLNAKWQEVFDAIVAGQNAVLYDAEALTAYPVKAAYKSGSDYVVEIGSDTYTAAAADGNPVKDET